MAPEVSAADAKKMAGVDAQILDSPIANPDDDLLGVAEPAKRLADYIRRVEPPFTIGIYGEWGSGKTSLVKLLHYYLTELPGRSGEELCFIWFSAWPYKTADELWRALILRIAQSLYAAPDPEAMLPPPPPKAPVIETLGQRLRAFLEGEALALRQPPPAPDPFDEYKELLVRLDATLYGGIGKSPQAQMQLGQQETLAAALKGILTMLSFGSPILGGLRSLFGLDTKVDLVDAFQREKNEATRDRIQSIGSFQRALRDLFETKAKGKRVCVFVDDLDRVMPDIALDLLEAIKSLLEGVKCTFIVAADQQLIGQGLKARLRELLDTGDRAMVESFYSRKGREYFEKIIQLGIPVPEPTAEQAHRFIAAQFPHWLAATDLIEAAVGTNPRRLKQYCNLLDYRFQR